MATIIVRKATEKDSELIAELSRQTFYETYAAHNVKEELDAFMSETYTKEALMKEVGAPGNVFFLAYDDDEAVGYLRLREHNDPKELVGLSVIEIARIYVVKKFIGKGIGKALMEKSISFAKENNKNIIWLAVWPKNKPAIDFYIKCGFEKFGEQDFVFGKEIQKDWLMKKEI
ncbi:MAG: GNAT family N-acetyltransferase [Chitinophagaceae bacterium]